MINKKNFPKHEFIGLEARIIDSLNKDQIGIKGKVVEETKKIIKIGDMFDEKSIQKSGTIFEFKIPKKGKITIIGDEIEVRPEDRIKKKFKRWKTL